MPCVRCNQTVKFADLIGAGARARARAAGDRPLRAADRRAGRAGTAPRGRSRRATRAGSCSPPRASSLALSLFPLGGMPDKRAVRARGRAARAAGGREAGQPGHLLRSVRALCRHRWRGCARMPASRARSSTETARVLGRHDGIARYTVGQGKRLGVAAVRWWRAAGRWLRCEPARRRVVVGPRSAGTRTVRLREVNWLVPPPDAALRLPGQAARARDAAARHRFAATAGGAPCRWTDAGAARARASLRVL